MDSDRPTILVLVNFYLPGYKGGGPIRTIEGMVHSLGDEFQFRIITLDRDLSDTKPYPGISVNEWQQVGKSDVFYISPENVTVRYLRSLINSTVYDILYLNSFFSPGFSFIPMLLQRMGLIVTKKTILAPRGEFSPGALRIKLIKKKLFINLAIHSGLYRNIVWHASSVHEAHDIQTVFKKTDLSLASNRMVIAPDLSIPVFHDRNEDQKEKKPGNLRAVFLSRISPKKNLDGALRMLHDLNGNVFLSIYGPVEDEVYWDSCKKVIDALPTNIQVNYRGSVPHENVAEIFSDHDLFFFPTHGENFGHVIVEALVAGCPVLISDQTPWRELESKGVGWDLPLARPEMFFDVLNRCVNMRTEEHRSMSKKAREYGLAMSLDQKCLQDNRNLFVVE